MFNFLHLLPVSGIVEQIYRQGDDALANQFDIIISPIPLFSVFDDLKFRALAVDIPEKVIETYQVDYKTTRFTKPSGKIGTANEFTMNFRSDKYWVVYQALTAWKNGIANEVTGAIAEDVNTAGISTIRTDMSLIPIDPNGLITGPGWKFHKAWPSTIGGVSFDQASGDPIEVSITFQFLKMTNNV